MFIKRSVIVLLGISLLSLSSCSTAANSSDTGLSSDITTVSSSAETSETSESSATSATSSSASMTYPDDPIPDDYIKDAEWPDGESFGRAYEGSLILHLNGREYLAVGELDLEQPDNHDKNQDLGDGRILDGSTNTVYYTDEYISRLKVGDEFAYGADLKFKIESLDVENWLERWWEIPFNTEDIPEGKIRLNKYFSLIHGFYERNIYNNVIDDSKTNLWQLCYEPELICGNTGVFKATGKVKLIELSDKCRFYFWQNGKGINDTQELTKEEFMGFFDGVNPHEGMKMMDVNIVVRKNQALEVRLEDRI